MRASRLLASLAVVFIVSPTLPAQAGQRIAAGKIVAGSGGITGAVISPEERAFVASGCAQNWTDGATAAVINVSAYRGRTLTLVLSGHDVQVGTWSAGASFIQQCTLGSAPAGTAGPFGSFGARGVVVPNNATYMKVYEITPGGAGLNYVLEG